MDDAHVIVGLGNPGRRYARTRHNVGFEVLSLLGERHGASFTGGRGDYLAATARIEGAPVVLARPTTFMNLSGRAVQGLVAFYKTPLERLLVVSDDVNLPLGTLRLRTAGSSGGHNGLEDIIYQLGSEDFPRLRVGVGGERMPQDLRGYVLDRFDKDDQPVIETAVRSAADAVECFIQEGIEAAMNRFN
jgi:PTH1 family peptidyl-tRNA hydrolase